MDVDLFASATRASVQVIAAAQLVILGWTRTEWTKARVMDHPVCRLLLDIIQNEPGIHLNPLRSRARIGWGALYHHLDKLTRVGLARVERRGRRREVRAIADQAVTRPKPLGRAPRAVARIITERGRVSIDDLVVATSLSKRTIYYHVRNLVRDGYVVSSSATRYADLCASDALSVALGRDDEA